MPTPVSPFLRAVQERLVRERDELMSQDPASLPVVRGRPQRRRKAPRLACYCQEAGCDGTCALRARRRRKRS